ncbi:MAG TPA: Ig-like domain-containing protein [Thermoanaerobaculia bacterium]
MSKMQRRLLEAALMLLAAGAFFWPAGALFYRRYLAAIYIGAAVGLGELVARYRDAPERALTTTPAILYILINAAASGFAMYAVWHFDVIKGQTGERLIILQILLAGFGAMAFFRTSVFTFRQGDQDIGIGPVAFLQVMLKATDRAVDRLRANERADRICIIMNGVSFERAKVALPTFAMALMQNVPPDEQKSVGDVVNALGALNTLDNDTKAKNLGLALMNIIGDDVLRTAVHQLFDQIQKTASIVIDSPPTTVKVGESAELTATCRAGDEQKTPLSGRSITWSSDQPATADVAQNGVVTGKSTGKTIIRAATDGAEAHVPVEVTL